MVILWRAEMRRWNNRRFPPEFRSAVVSGFAASRGRERYGALAKTQEIGRRIRRSANKIRPV